MVREVFVGVSPSCKHGCASCGEFFRQNYAGEILMTVDAAWFCTPMLTSRGNSCGVGANAVVYT